MNPIEKVGAELIKLGGWVKHNFFKKSDYIITSRGAVDAGLPVITNASGVLDSTLTGGGGGGANIAYTNINNDFTHGQSITPNLADVPLGGEEFTNGGFDTDISGWTDDGSGWAWNSGALVHTPGVEGFLTQSVTPSVSGDVYLLEMRVTARTAGAAEIYDSVASLDLYETTNGIFQQAKVITGVDLFTIYVTADFDGRIEYVSLKRMDGYPANLYLYKTDGTIINEIRSANGGVYVGLYAGLRSQNANNVGIGNSALDTIVDQTGNTALGQSAGSLATCNGGLFLGASAGVGETVDSKLHIGNNGDIISGTMDSGNAATQTIQVHAATIIFADLPTAVAGAGELWNKNGLIVTGTPTIDADTLAGTTPTTFGLSLIDDADAATARATLGLVDGSDKLLTSLFGDVINSGVMRNGTFTIGSGSAEIQSTGGGAGYALTRRDLGAWPGSPAAGDRWVIYAADNTKMRIYTDGGDKATLDTSGNLVLTGTVSTAAGAAWNLSTYTAGAPAATGYVTVVINGTTYKLLAST